MKLSRSGTVRFAKVVETAGKPDVVSLWTKPERDKNFMTAVRQNRLMTIKQKTVGSAEDFGVVGFLREKNASYLVFRNPLTQFQDRRIIGIKYDLIETPGPIGRLIKPGIAQNPARTSKTPPAEWSPEPPANETLHKRTKKFTVTIRITAITKVRHTIEARSKAEAKELALQQALMPDFSRGTVTRKILKIVHS
jgi:hypothetical protein